MADGDLITSSTFEGANPTADGFTIQEDGGTVTYDTGTFRSGASALQLTHALDTGQLRCGTSFGAGQRRVAQRFYMRVSSLPSTGTVDIFRPASCNSEMYLSLSSAGTVTFYTDGDGTGTSIGTVSADGNWDVIEVETDGDTGGEIDHWASLNGASASNITDTASPNDLSDYTIGSYSQAATSSWDIFFDDWIVYEGALADLPAKTVQPASSLSTAEPAVGTARVNFTVSNDGDVDSYTIRYKSGSGQSFTDETDGTQFATATATTPQASVTNVDLAGLSAGTYTIGVFLETVDGVFSAAATDDVTISSAGVAGGFLLLDVGS